jgi:release factor glutamine methyltransferase
MAIMLCPGAAMEYDDIDIETSDDVYPPSEDSRLTARMISFCLSAQQKGRALDILDLGTATGILGIFAASHDGVKNVTCADINPRAVELARKNAEKNKDSLYARISFTETDLFSNIPANTKYDLIVFNAPYLRSENHKNLDDIRWSGDNCKIAT